MPLFTHECLASHMNTDVPMEGKKIWIMPQ